MRGVKAFLVRSEGEQETYTKETNRPRIEFLVEEGNPVTQVMDVILGVPTIVEIVKKRDGVPVLGVDGEPEVMYREDRDLRKVDASGIGNFACVATEAAIARVEEIGLPMDEIVVGAAIQDVQTDAL